MSYVYTVYKCSDGKMVISDNNHASTKLDTTKTDTTTTISKATATPIRTLPKCMSLHGHELQTSQQTKQLLSTKKQIVNLV